MRVRCECAQVCARPCARATAGESGLGRGSFGCPRARVRTILERLKDPKAERAARPRANERGAKALVEGTDAAGVDDGLDHRGRRRGLAVRHRQAHAQRVKRVGNERGEKEGGIARPEARREGDLGGRLGVCVGALLGKRLRWAGLRRRRSARALLLLPLRHGCLSLPGEHDLLKLRVDGVDER